jgi:transglutaminase-like putative cysteine protease
MSASLRLTLAAAAAVLLSSAALSPVYLGLGWLLPVVGTIAVVSAATAAGRSRGVPVPLQPVVGLTALAVWTVVLYARSTLAYGLLPTGETVVRLRTLLGEALLDVDALAAPVPTAPGLVLLAVLGVGALAAVVDLVAVGLRRPAATGLPLLLLFAVPSGTVAGGVGWWPFALGAAGWLGLLLVEGGDRLTRWGAPATAAAASSYADPGVHRVGRRIGAAALGVAVVVPALVPGLDARLFDGGTGSGLGGGSRSTTTYNPITRLADQLRLPTPQDLLVYRTDDPSPDYVRMTTLDLYDGAGWSASRLSGSKENLITEGIPTPIGLDGTPARTVRTEFSVAGLDGPWLPVTVTPQDIELDGPWLWDPEAETVFSTRRSLQDLDEPYAVVATRVEPTPERLREGGPLLGDVPTLAVPPEVSPYVRQLTERIVAGKQNDYDKVVALQAFFTDEANGFTYSDESTVPGTNAPDALENFLRPENDGRRGFCEQYASAMAALVRVLGLPSRVSVGFTPGEQRPDGTHVITTQDAHAWPEVWFNGAGWVRFEPTPRGQIVDVPAYTVPPAPVPGEPAAPEVAEPSAGPTADPGTSPAQADGGSPLDDGASDPEAVDLGAEEESRLGLVALVLAVALALALVPLALAAVRRRRRWATPSAAVAWAQVHDDAADVGHRWRAQDSPRAAAAHLLADRDLPGPAAQALQRLAAQAERARFAARPEQGTDGATLVEDAREVRAGLATTASTRDRWRARLLPPSTLHWASAGLGRATADGLDRLDEALAAAGNRARGAVGRSRARRA